MLFDLMAPPNCILLYGLACLAWTIGVAFTIIADLLKTKLSNRLALTLTAGGALAAGIGAIGNYQAGAPVNFTALKHFGLTTLSFTGDNLAIPFILLLTLVALASTLSTRDLIDSTHNKEGHRFQSNHYYRLILLLLLGTLLVLLSANAITFLVFWEVMSVAAASLITSEHVRHRAQRAALAYITASRLATALLTGAFLWMYHQSGTFDFAGWQFQSNSTFPAALLILLAVCIKAGIWPAHGYLPQSYAEAPGPAAALISGVIGKTAIYLLLRLLVLGNCQHSWVIYIALALGTISCIWGILFALVERDLKRLLAFSSVENMGLIIIAISLSMLARKEGLPVIAAIAVTGTLFHAFNHGVFKSLLMLAASTIDKKAHPRDLAQLGGLAKRLPWTMLAFFIGSVAICALPPSNGFASKWLIYQAFFRMAIESVPLHDRAISLAMLGILSFVGALSLACYTKAIGIAFLGRPRSKQAQFTPETGLSGSAMALVILSAICVFLGTSAGICLRAITPALAELNGSGIDAANLFPVAVAQLSLFGLITASIIYLCILGPRSTGMKTYITWDCGYGPLSARAEETGSSFSHPIGRIFSQVLQLKVETNITGRDRRHFPEGIKVETRMTPFIETTVYKRFIEMVNFSSLTLTRLQTGSIHVHLLYLFLTMIVLVYLGTVL